MTYWNRSWKYQKQGKMTLHFFCILVSWLLAERGCVSCVTTWIRIWPVHAMWQNTNSYGVSLKTKCLRYFSRDVLTPVLTKYSCIIVYQVLLRNTDNLTEVNLLLRQYETYRKGFRIFWLWVTSKKTFAMIRSMWYLILRRQFCSEKQFN